MSGGRVGRGDRGRGGRAVRCGRGGRSGRTGRGGRGGRGTTPRVVRRAATGFYVATTNIDSGAAPVADKCLPDRYKACTTGWEKMEVPRFEIVTPKEFNDKHSNGSLVDSYLHIEKEMSSYLRRRGLPTTDASALEELCSGAVFEMLAECTTEALVKRSLESTSAFEIKRFLAHTLLRSRHQVSIKLA